MEKQEKTIEEGFAELEKGRQELADGWKEYKEGAEEARVELGDARDFFQRIVWADKSFGQLRSGSGTDLGLDITYFYRGMQRKVSCRIPTVRGDDFWRLGISLDASLHLKVYLGSGKNYIESAPIPLALT